MPEKEFDVEKSREMRLWAKTGVSAASTVFLIDYLVNDGKLTKSVCNGMNKGYNKVKEKVIEIKEKLAKKPEAEKESE